MGDAEEVCSAGPREPPPGPGGGRNMHSARTQPLSPTGFAPLDFSQSPGRRRRTRPARGRSKPQHAARSTQHAETRNQYAGRRCSSDRHGRQRDATRPPGCMVGADGSPTDDPAEPGAVGEGAPRPAAGRSCTAGRCAADCGKGLCLWAGTVSSRPDKSRKSGPAHAPTRRGGALAAADSPSATRGLSSHAHPLRGDANDVHGAFSAG